jgi:hypothetical protein
MDRKSNYDWAWVRELDVIQTRACQGYRGNGHAEVGTDVGGVGGAI